MILSAKCAVPFRIILKRSFILNGALLFMYLGTFYWLSAFNLNIAIKLVLFAVITAGFVTHVRQYLLRNSKRSVNNLLWQDQNQWQLTTATGEMIKARLLGSSFVNPWLIVLNFKPEQGGRMLPVVIMSDGVNRTTFRRLSAKLRMYGAEVVNDSDH